MRLVIVGFGYSARAVARALGPLERLTVTTRAAEKRAMLQAEGFNALCFDGKRLEPALRCALEGASHLLMSAPPDETGDPLLGAAGALLEQAPALRAIAYLSTVGVYGDHGGAWVDEDSPLRSVSPRSRQRVAAEQAWRDLAARRRLALGVFRLSGIYGPGRSAIEALRAGTARRIVKPGQVFNRIHVADIGAAVATGLRAPERLDLFNLSDDEPAPPQDVVAHAAALMGLPPPPELPFATAALSPMGRSFYSENRRVANARLKSVLGHVLRYPTYREGLAALLAGA